MKTKLQLLLLFSLSGFCAFSQSGRYWKPINKTEIIRAANLKPKVFPAASHYYQLDLESLKTVLLQASGNNSIIAIPDNEGQVQHFKIGEDSNFAPGLQAQYPDIRAYSGKGIEDPTALLKISLAPTGIETMLIRAGRPVEFIEPCNTSGTMYALFNSVSEENGLLAFTCSTKTENDSAEINFANKNSQSNTHTLKKFRLALSCTIEYATYYGGTVAGILAGMNATMTRVNGILENDFAVKFEIIENNAAVIFTDSATYPYDDVVTGSAPSPGTPTWNDQLQNVLTTVIGDENYDVGHLLAVGLGNGSAGCIGCVCDSGKGRAFSASSGPPEGDFFDVRTVAHEMGHQLGATHVLSNEFQAGGTLIEPGSGSTIMGYAGITQLYDVQATSDPYFNARNILQVQTNMASKFCSTDITLPNVAPVVSAGADFTIPKGTPFVLTGTATASNLAALTYTWEENDNITSSAQAGSNSFASPTKTIGPDFRSILPGASPTRYFPALNTVLSNVLSTPFESVANVARTFKFLFTARDNAAGGGQTATDNNVITVSGTKGPFDVTSQNTDDISWVQGSTQTITWTVNSTDTLAGSANVDILLSTDGGQTYPIILLSNTPNDGSQEITVPNIIAVYCRVMVKPTGNVFYDINTKPFSIGYTTTCTTYTSSSPLVIPDGIGNEVAGPTVSSTFSVPVTGVVTDVNVTLNVSHPWSSDLIITLKRPDNTETSPWNRRCFLGNDWNFTFSDGMPSFDCIDNIGTSSGAIAPSLPLSVLNNGEASGTWTLTATDYKSGNAGQINSWSVEVCEKVLVPLGVNDYSLDKITLYPNPSTTTLTISVPEGKLPDSFTMYNSIGQCIGNTIVKSVSSLTIDTTPMSDGVYFIKINQDGKSKTLRFVKNQ